MRPCGSVLLTMISSSLKGLSRPVGRTCSRVIDYAVLRGRSRRLHVKYNEVRALTTQELQRKCYEITGDQRLVPSVQTDTPAVARRHERMPRALRRLRQDRLF